MKFKMTPIKICSAMILGVFAFGFSLASLDKALTRYEIQNRSASGYAIHNHSAPSELVDIAELSQPTSEPMVRLFQLLFILFIISPPIIALMLFLIWKELRARNKMK